MSVQRGPGVPRRAGGSPDGGTGTLLFSSAEGTLLERASIRGVSKNNLEELKKQLKMQDAIPGRGSPWGKVGDQVLPDRVQPMGFDVLGINLKLPLVALMSPCCQNKLNVSVTPCPSRGSLGALSPAGPCLLLPSSILELCTRAQKDGRCLLPSSASVVLCKDEVRVQEPGTVVPQGAAHGLVPIWQELLSLPKFPSDTLISLGIFRSKLLFNYEKEKGGRRGEARQQ